VTGTAGSGKSRLALELCREADSEWHAGFLSRTEKNFKWSQFRPSRKTLIVIDYVASRAAEVGEAVLMLSRVSSSFTKPVRVLLVERGKDSWWTTFSREESQSESAEIAACEHGEPLGVSGLSPEAILQLAEQVVRARNGAWNPALAREFLSRLLRYDPCGRPLFAMIVANYLDSVEAATPNLLQVVLKREAARRSKLIQDQGKLQRMENLLLLATLASGLLPKANSFAYLAASNVARLLPDADLLDETLYNELAGAAGASASIAGLQPDILGERFLLDRLSADGIIGQNARRLLLAAWSFQPNDVRVVAIRSAFDFKGDAGLSKLFDLPLDSGEARTEWGNMVGDLIAVTGRPPDEMSLQLLEKLIGVANLYPQEREMQEATARAEYNMGQVLMFLEGRVAVELFDAAIARAGKDSPIAKAAIHNRAILKLGEGNDNSFNDFTIIIDSPELSDESRACALNNRADLYAERGEHDKAIRDRTEVLALNDTSPDRRYIALFRRSRSYSAIGNDQAALDDLGRILKTWDISPQQKAEARLERALIMRYQGRWDEARAELEAVINSSELFSGTRAMALVEMAEVTRRMGDFAQADGFLSKAIEDPDAGGETLIDAMIVGALLLQDTGQMDEAIEMWRKVIGAPGASDNQVRVARQRLDEISH
jgi:tetratricopeptide (TPR) repeat protein